MIRLHRPSRSHLEGENDGVEPLEGDGQGDVNGSHSEGVHQTVVDPHAVGEQILPEPLGQLRQSER